MTKLSPAQRKVLEVMAGGATVTRYAMSRQSDCSWNGHDRPLRNPTWQTMNILNEGGYVSYTAPSVFSGTWSITPKGREALK